MFTATTKTQARPSEVLDILTDPAAIHAWSPVPFNVDDVDGDRLEAGSSVHVSGRLAGVSVGFDVTIETADDERLELTACGPIGLDVRYELRAESTGSTIEASVEVRRGGGITGRVIAKATEALLAAGALDGAAGRIARAAEMPALAA